MITKQSQLTLAFYALAAKILLVLCNTVPLVSREVNLQSALTLGTLNKDSNLIFLSLNNLG